MKNAFIPLNGKSLTIDTLMFLGQGNYGIELTNESAELVAESRRVQSLHLAKLAISTV
jgi:hypothetical protein